MDNKTDKPRNKVLSLKQSLIPPEIRAAWAKMDEDAKFAWYYNELVQLKVQIKELEARITRMEEGD